MNTQSLVEEYLEESWWAGDIHDDVESVFKDCTLYVQLCVEPFTVDPTKVMLELIARAPQVARIVR